MNKSAPTESESDTNLSPQRRAWAEKNLDPEAQTLLAEDEKYFLRQSVSTPCLNAIAKAEGIWIEDTAGRRYMDFHGNNVHHIGYGHPRLKKRDRRADGRAAVRAAPLHLRAGGRACRQARRDRARQSLQGAVHHRRLGCGRSRDQDRARRDRPLQDAVVLGRVPRRGLRRIRGRRRGAVPLRRRRPADAGRRARRALCVLSLPLWHLDHRRERGCLRAHDRIRAGARRGHRGLHRRADARGAAHSAARLLAPRARGLRPPRHAADLRRDPDRPRQDRQDVRLPARRRGAGPAGARQGARRRHPADRRGDRAARARCRRRLRLRPLHAREKSGDDARGADHDPDHRGRGAGRERRAGRRRPRWRGCTR